MEEGLIVRGNKDRDRNPLLLKLGIALALSFAGFFASKFSPKPQLPPPKSSQGDDESKESSGKSPKLAGRSLEDEVQILSSEEVLAKIINRTPKMANSTTGAADEDELLLPEFNQFVMKEFEAYPDMKSVEAVNEELEFQERMEMKNEISYLRNLVEALKERERNLELQMIEYYGLKEQEASLRELENRLKVNAMEHKFLSLKIESLRNDNQKLQAQVSDYPKIVSELEAASEEIQLLKMKLKSDGEQAKEKLVGLHGRITELVERERKQGEDDVEVDRKLKRLKELEDEVVDLRKVNARLAEENLRFAQQLDSIKMELSSNHNQSKVEALDEARKMREDNDNLRKEIEQLQTDRCADVEELVYLRWVNACLRYELRNYQPAPGKTVAKDLNRCMSPESEMKAKQLIVEYANSCTDGKNMDLYDFDTESCSSSQTSGEDYSDTSIDICSSTKNSRSSKSKLFSKLRKLVMGKDNQRSKVDPIDGTNTMRRASVSSCSFEDISGRRSSFDSVTSCVSQENTFTNHLNATKPHANGQRHFEFAQAPRHPRSSLDAQRMKKLDSETKEGIAERCRSDLGTSHGHMRMISEGCLSDLSLNEDANTPEKLKLRKFADVLKGSRGLLKSKKRQASFSSN